MLNTVNSPTASAEGNIRRTSIKFFQAAFFAIRYHASRGSANSPCLRAASKSLFRLMICKPASFPLNSQNANLSMENFAFCETAGEVPGKEKRPQTRQAFAAFEFNPGGDLRSRAVTRAVSSAQQGLTSVFGMGTGVTLAIRPPGNWKSKLGSRKSRGVSMSN